MYMRERIFAICISAAQFISKTVFLAMEDYFMRRQMKAENV